MQLSRSSDGKKTIILHGKLKNLFPEPLECYADTVAEAIRFLSHKFEAFQNLTLTEKPCYQVVGFDSKESLYQKTDVSEIHLVPAFIGAKKGGFMQIVIGAVIIAAAIWLGPGVITFLGMPMFTTGSMLLAGAAMVLGGVVQMMSASPSRDLGPDAASDPAGSRYLGAGGNTTASGTRIPIAYGRSRMYGHYLSFDTQATKIAATAT